MARRLLSEQANQNVVKVFQSVMKYMMLTDIYLAQRAVVHAMDRHLQQHVQRIRIADVTV
jgi:hypothetical protein